MLMCLLKVKINSKFLILDVIHRVLVYSAPLSVFLSEAQTGSSNRLLPAEASSQ